MSYWEGNMDWGVRKDWKCEVCNIRSDLTWVLRSVYAQCRCNNCHTQYRMRDANGGIVATPICQLKEEYYKPAIKGYAKYKIPISEFSDEIWNEFKEG